MNLLDTDVVSGRPATRRTPLVHVLTVVTRNGSDFESTGAEVVNPWL